ncbi:hypothetical protein [Herpetosiphon geysericola]|uniref:SWIM-type domain-containing protein n=1 Tax=Herpetosiphon geysericola TaxID=70996 RepID=A0A0P6YKL4_9CHLR|nr:hypothetical protein [Herpetosiphon geysericola]KPL83047.1 hypothetical protein SE18_19595 [Herpetosiphon geysericola]
MNALIVPEAARMRQALYAQIATTTSARDLHALARSLSAVERAVALIAAQHPQAIDDLSDDVAQYILVSDGTRRYRVTVGHNAAGIPWQCPCPQKRRGYKDTCIHMIAVSLWLAAERERQRQSAHQFAQHMLNVAITAYEDATEHRMRCEEQLAEAHRVEAQAWQIVSERREDVARIERQAPPPMMPPQHNRGAA